MPSALRWLFLGIVLLDLAFVQLTGTVTSPWLWALWSCAAATPLFARFAESPVYRGIWNAAVLASFAFLVHDAVTSGLLHMLEDGLLLSALCQVHLLNNIGQKQRPDLLFFNSFLIAFVTSFFCGDLGWSIAFFAYAALLVLALQLHVCLPRSGEQPRGAVRALIQNGLWRSAAALLATALVFALWPRDFKREGWLGDSMQFGGAPVVAFADQVRIDRSTTPTLSDAPVMRIASKGEANTPTHWRGATFVNFDGAGWQPFRIREFGTRTATDIPWSGTSATRWVRASSRDEGRRRDAAAANDSDAVTVTLLDTSANRLFLPLEAESFDLHFTAGALVDPKADGVVALVEFGEGPREVRFSVRASEVAAFGELTPAARAILTQTPERLPSPLVALEEELRRTLPADASPQRRAEHARDWLSAERRYALPGTPAAARSLDDFLLGSGGGHCEYFATALCLVLRMQSIPCRVIGGYLAQERDASSGAYVVRQRHAHAWVEAWLPGVGWTTLDATPAMADEGGAHESGMLADMRKWLEEAWANVTGFGEAERAALFSAIGRSLGETVVAFLTSPIECAALLALLSMLSFWRRHVKNQRIPLTVRALDAAMRRAHVQLVHGETPRELLLRAQAMPIAADAMQRLAAAISAHERERYSR